MADTTVPTVVCSFSPTLRGITSAGSPCGGRSESYVTVVDEIYRVYQLVTRMRRFTAERTLVVAAIAHANNFVTPAAFRYLTLLCRAPVAETVAAVATMVFGISLLELFVAQSATSNLMVWHPVRRCDLQYRSTLQLLTSFDAFQRCHSLDRQPNS